MKDILNQIKTFTGVFSKEQFDRIHSVLKEPIWHKNNSRPDAESTFWGIGNLQYHEFFSKKLMDHIRTVIGNEYKLDHILVNSQSTLQDGEPHFDNHQKNGYTFMVYMNPVWDIQWGGTTIFLDRYVDEDKNIIVNSQRNVCLFPTPNMGVLFPSNIIHFAFGPTRKFSGQRITLAYKLYTGDDFQTFEQEQKNAKQSNQ
jgi:hypothetical protein